MADQRHVALSMLLASLLGLPAGAVAEEPEVADIVVWMSVEVAADGHVISATARNGTLPQLGSALSKRALEWRYSPATWQGKPVPVRQWLSVAIEPVPTTAGGYALRITGNGTGPAPESRITPPHFPRAAMIAGTNALLVYRVQVAEDGSMVPVDRLEPKVVKGHLKSLDKVSREAIATYRTVPSIVDGVAVACEIRYPIAFATTQKITMPDLEKLEPLEHQCPKAKLETDIEGTML